MSHPPRRVVVETFTVTQAEARRAAALASLDITEAELYARGNNYQCSVQERAVLSEVDRLDFLLAGDDE